MTDLDLDAIEARARLCASATLCPSTGDVPALVAEVRSLREKLECGGHDDACRAAQNDAYALGRRDEAEGRGRR